MRLLHTENIGGRIERWWLHVGEDGKDRITVETVQDVEPIVETNTRLYNDAPKRFGKGTFHRVASIPQTVIEELCRVRQIPVKEVLQNKTDRAQKLWNELLNAPEFRAFRTRPGRVDMRHGS